MPPYPLRESLLVEPLAISDGCLVLSDVPGLGVTLPPDVEARHAFREDAVYNCAPAIGRLLAWDEQS
jgi:L-alanine-DL-glutamate epimerase-like enolase superfamily enzyme